MAKILLVAPISITIHNSVILILFDECAESCGMVAWIVGECCMTAIAALMDRAGLRPKRVHLWAEKEGLQTALFTVLIDFVTG
jgi:hypothetical protein